MRDLYADLRVKPTASTDEIKAAYRKLAHKTHPDRKGGSAAKFRIIQEAYETLSDPSRRSSYDFSVPSQGPEEAPPPPPPPPPPYGQARRAPGPEQKVYRERPWAWTDTEEEVAPQRAAPARPTGLDPKTRRWIIRGALIWGALIVATQGLDMLRGLLHI